MSRKDDIDALVAHTAYENELTDEDASRFLQRLSARELRERRKEMDMRPKPWTFAQLAQELNRRFRT